VILADPRADHPLADTPVLPEHEEASVRRAVLDPARLAALQDTGLLDTGAEEAFDRFTRLASALLRAPTAVVTLVDAERQFFKSAVGLAEPAATDRQNGLAYSYCRYVVAAGEPLAASDTPAHPLLAASLGTTELGVRAYLGAPLRTGEGHVLGSLCVLDSAPHVWTARDRDRLLDLAAAVTAEIEVRAARHRAERERAFVATLLDSLGTAVLACGPDGGITLWNRAFAELHASPESVFCHPDGTPLAPADDPLQRALRGETVRDAEVTLVRPGVAPRILAAAGEPVADAAGTSFGAVVTLHDVTALKTAESHALRARDAAEAASRAKSDFLARMSHELRTPLNAVIGFARILLKNRGGGMSAQELDYAERIHGNGRHLLGLIDTILDVSRIEAGAEELVLADADVAALVREVVDSLQCVAAEKGIALAAESGVAATARVDVGKLRQVLLNLVGNAVKFTEAGGVRVALVRDPDSGAPLRIDVADTGIGIAPERLEAIFDAFQQADGSTSRRYGGTGLGLTISRALCGAMGCRLEVESAPGRGSVFRIRFPRD